MKISSIFSAQASESFADKVIQRANLEAKKKALFAAQLAAERKAEDIVILDMRKVANFCDYFLICSAASSRRAQAVAELIEEKFREAGLKPRSGEGKSEGMWILLDYSDVVIHIFFKDVRDTYGLERLWADAKKVHVPTGRKKDSLASKRKRRKLS